MEYHWLTMLCWFCFLFCVFVSFVFNCLISFWGSFVCVVVLFFFVFFGSVFVSFGCVSLFLFFDLWFCFYHLSGVLFVFFSSSLIPFIAMTSSLQGPGSPTGSRAWASWVGALSPGCWTTREFLAPGNINSESSHRGLHPNPRPSSTQLPAAPTTRHLMPNNKQDRNTNPPISRQAA